MASDQAQRLRKRVLGWVRDMKVPGEPCVYRMSATGEPTLEAALMAMSVRHLYGDLTRLDQDERRAWVDFLTAMQDGRTGLFRGYAVEQAAQHDQYGADYIAYENTAFALPVLDLLSERPRHPLAFLAPWLDEKHVRDFVLARDWSKPWHETDLMVCVAIILAYDMQEVGDPAAHRRAFGALFDALDTLQDAATGLWGTDLGADPYDAMAGTWHLFLVYNYMRRPIRYGERIIDNVLTLQRDNGHMFEAERRFGSCFDMDATDLLVNLHRALDYRRPDIEQALRRLLDANLRLQNPDGGFRPSPSTSASTTWEMGTNIRNPLPGESDMQATWFRSIVTALICQVFTHHPLASLDWGFHKRMVTGWYRK